MFVSTKRLQVICPKCSCETPKFDAKPNPNPNSNPSPNPSPSPNPMPIRFGQMILRTSELLPHQTDNNLWAYNEDRKQKASYLLQLDS